MENVTFWVLILAVCANGVVWFFKSPKEMSAESERRIVALEVLFAALALKVEGTYSRHDQILINLTVAVEKLAARFDRYTEIRYGNESK